MPFKSSDIHVDESLTCTLQERSLLSHNVRDLDDQPYFKHLEDPLQPWLLPQELGELGWVGAVPVRLPQGLL